ncbi:MAG: hypothetical protein KDE56_01285 [Anaerolineales bacterium]|nr:hypothetical protein [Anaerolineales bacterium]
MSVPTFSTYQIGRWLLLVSLLILSACTPETVIQDLPQEVTTVTQPTPVETMSLENPPIVVISSATPIATQTLVMTILPPKATQIEPPTILSSEVVISPLLTPEAKPIIISETEPTEKINAVINIDKTSYGLEVTQYDFESIGALTAILPNNDLLVQINGTLFSTNIRELTSHPLISDITNGTPILVVPNTSRLIVPITLSSKEYPVWSIGTDGSTPLFMGTTSGFFPLFSATSDGKVLMLEDGHLVLRWYEGTNLYSQHLNHLEEILQLKWSTYNLTLGPSESNWETPWIDFEISPNGQWIALFDGKESKLWLATIDGEIIQDVQLDPFILSSPDPQVRFLHWSPDSQKIAYREGIYSSGLTTNYQQLKIATINSKSTPIKLTNAHDSIAGVAAWSFDGNAIAYTLKSLDNAQGDVNHENMKLFVALPDGSNPQQVSNSFYLSNFTSLFWQNNSQALVYTCRTHETNRTSVCVTSLAQ